MQNAENAERDGLTDYEGAEDITGIRRGTLASMVSRRQIPHVRIGPRLVRFEVSALRSWIADRRVAVGSR